MIIYYSIIASYHYIIPSYCNHGILPKSHLCLYYLQYTDLVRNLQLPNDSLSFFENIMKSPFVHNWISFFDSACESSGCSLDSLKRWLCLQLVPRDTFPKPTCLAWCNDSTATIRNWLNLHSLTSFLQKFSNVEQLSVTRCIGLKVHTSLNITVGLPPQAMKAPGFWAKRWWKSLCSCALPIVVLGITE